MDVCIATFLGRIEYTRAWDLQRRLHGEVADGTRPNLMLLLEHPHVFTLGRRGKPEDVLTDQDTLSSLGIEVHAIDRGGEVTYHGPGQLICYPIVSLRRWNRGPLRYVRALEETLVATLGEFGIEADSAEKPTGVWVGDAKIAAIGVKMSRGVTMHGMALNVAPDLSFFDRIVPCGMPGVAVTSMFSLMGQDVEVKDVVPIIARHFGRAMGYQMEPSAFSYQPGPPLLIPDI